MVADITSTGTTLRDNQLKIVGGPILRSQACLVGSRRSLRATPTGWRSCALSLSWWKRAAVAGIMCR